MSHARGRLLIIGTLLLLATTVSWAQLGMAVGRGEVTDHEGNPLKGVRVVFENTAAEGGRYEATTNKKGRFYIDNLMYQNTGRWIVTPELEGYVATRMKVESRTQQAVIGKVDLELSPNKKPTEIDIRPFGTATFEIVMTPEDVYAASRAPAPEETVPAAPGEEAPTRAAPQEDPFQTAFRMANAGDLEGSLPFFEKAAKNAPDDAELLEGWANVLYRLDRPAEAMARARQAIEAAPTTLGPYKIVYSAQVSAGDLEGAAETLDAIEANVGTDAWVLEQRAVLASRSGDPEAAIAAYENIVAADPANKEAWVALGTLYADAGRNDESRAAFQKVVEIDPSGAYKTFYNIGALIRNQPNASPEENDRAIAAFRKSIEINPDYAPSYRELAYALLGKGDLAGAKTALESYLEAAPDAPDAAQIRAMVQGLGGGS